MPPPHSKFKKKTRMRQWQTYYQHKVMRSSVDVHYFKQRFRDFREDMLYMDTLTNHESIYDFSKLMYAELCNLQSNFLGTIENLQQLCKNIKKTKFANTIFPSIKKPCNTYLEELEKQLDIAIQINTTINTTTTLITNLVNGLRHTKKSDQVDNVNNENSVVTLDSIDTADTIIDKVDEVDEDTR